MQSVQLFAQIQGATGNFHSSFLELDLYEEQPIKFTKSVQSVDNVQQVNSTFSKPFKIPHTSSNGQFMKAVFNVNSTDFDATKKCEAYIYVSGVYFLSGNIRLQSIIRNDKQTKIEYEIIFFGETSTFSSNLGNKLMSEVEIGLSHTFNFFNIESSWDQNLLNGDIIYPLVEWGYTYDNGLPNESTLSVYNGTSSLKGFTNSSNPLEITQFKPFIRLKKILDKIFESSGFRRTQDLGDVQGFSYESDFFNSEFFKKIYYFSTSKETSNTEITDGAYFKVNANKLNYIIAPLYLQNNNGGYVKLLANINLEDNTNSYFRGRQYQGLSNYDYSYYKTPFSGSYTIKLENFALSSTSSGASSMVVFTPSANYSIQIWVGGTTPGTDKFIYFDSARTQRSVTFNPIFINANQEVSFGIFKNNSDTTFTLEQGSILMNIAGAIAPKGFLPDEIKQIDFIKGISDRFKLVWEADPENKNKIKIEPWKDWIKGGTAYDWSDKLNENFDVLIEPLFYKYSQNLIFKDKEEADIYNKKYQDQYKQTFGEFLKDSTIDIIKGTETVTSVFSPLQVAPLLNAEEMLIPHLAKETNSEVQPIQVKPRLCFYNGLVETPYTWHVKDELGTTWGYDYYPLVSNFDTTVGPPGSTGPIVFDESSFDISWSNVKQYWVPDIIGFDGRTSSDAYNVFWSTWIDYIYDPYSRIMTATFALDFTDINQLRFNDKIWIKDAWWIPLEIIDFQIGVKQNIKVKLLKLGQFGISFGSNAPRFYVQRDLCFGGTLTEACCCLGPATVTLYTDNADISLSTSAYLDEDGTLYPSPGFYNKNGVIIEVGPFGQIISQGNCDFVSCEPLGLTEFTDVCWGDSLCEACCCLMGTMSVWGDGVSLDLSTRIYATNIGLPLTPNRWYKKDGVVVQVGPDGTLINQFATCDFCDCEPAEQGLNLGGWYDNGDDTGTQKACCIQGTTGNLPIATYFILEGEDFYSATGIYVSNSTSFPLGTTGQGYTGPVAVSDGQYVKKVEDGVVLTTGNCLYVEPCSGRTTLVDFNTSHTAGDYIGIDYSYSIGFGPYDFYVGSTGISGTSFSQTVSHYYDPTSTVKATAIVTGTTGTFSYTIVQDGVTGATGSASVPGTLTTVPFIAGTGSSEINFTWSTP